MEHYFSHAERRAQLERLVATLDDLIPVLGATPGYNLHAPTFQAARDQAVALLSDGFEQAELSELARAVPTLFHPKEDPPLEPTAEPGGWREPNWYTSLTAKLQPALAAAETLRTIGYRT